jgi:hypothetical protein
VKIILLLTPESSSLLGKTNLERRLIAALESRDLSRRPLGKPQPRGDKSPLTKALTSQRTPKCAFELAKKAVFADNVSSFLVG